jgi:hypothetical protein
MVVHKTVVEINVALKFESRKFRMKILTQKSSIKFMFSSQGVPILLQV